VSPAVATCFIAAILVLGASAKSIKDTLYAVQSECGNFCYYYKRLNLVQIDSETAQVTQLFNLVSWNYQSVIDRTITVSTYDPELEVFYVATCDSTAGIGTLFAFNIQTMDFAKVSIPASYGGYNISNLEYDFKERHLLGNYGPELVRILINGRVDPVLKIFDGRYFQSGNRSALNHASRKYYVDVYEGKCMYIYTVDLKNGSVTSSKCYDQSPWIEDPFLRIMVPHYEPDTVLTLWGGNYGRVEILDSMTGNSKIIFSDQQFSENKWSTLFYSYYGNHLDSFNPVTNQLFMILREVRPIWLEDVLIGRIDLNTHGSYGSNFLDTSYFSYSNLQVYYKKSTLSYL